MGWLKDVSKDSAVGVIVAIVTGGSGLAVIVWLWKYLIILGDLLWRGLSYPVAIPIWCILVASVMLLIFIPTVVKIMKRSDETTANDHPKNTLNKILNYTEDNLFGMDLTWRWDQDYFDKTYRLGSLIKRCPNCHAILEEKHYSYPKIRCITQGCNWHFADQNNLRHLHEIDTAIAREIDRRAHLIQLGKSIDKEKIV